MAYDEARSEERMIEEFKLACRHGDANSAAVFGPSVTDWDAPIRALGGAPPKRVQTLSEAMNESLGYRDGPSRDELMQLLLDLANRPPATGMLALQAQALRLIDSMAGTFAAHNAGWDV